MMSFDNIDGFVIESVLSCDSSTDLWMRPFDIVVHRLSDIMEQSSLQSECCICTDEFRDRLSDIGDFLRVHEDILTIACTESEFTNQWDDLVWNPSDSHLIDSLSSEISDKTLCIMLILFDDLLDTSGLDSLIFDQFLERFLRDIPPKKVKARDENRIWCVIDN